MAIRDQTGRRPIPLRPEGETELPLKTMDARRARWLGLDDSSAILLALGWIVLRSIDQRQKATLGLWEQQPEVSAWFAERFLTELARIRVQAVEMRPSFAREPEPPCQRLDLHLNLRGHPLVGDAPLPEVEQARLGIARWAPASEA